jgi:predicted metal-dependent HD superfamily phosphohydrolase
MISPERLDGLQRGWLWLLQPAGIEPNAAYTLFDQLVELYSEAGRFYHTLEHIGEVLRVVGRLGVGLPNLQTVQLAVWFHDAIYDPKSPENEAESAALATRSLTALGLPTSIVERVSELIRSTTHFSPEAFEGRDVDILHDADLAILGAGQARYLRYADDVRKEYAWVPDATYRAGRIQVLESFLKRANIYRIEVMRAEGEAQARQNIQDEISRLSS